MNPRRSRSPGLRTAVALAGEGWDTISATGKVTVPPDRLVKISPRIEGKVVAAHGTVGDAVSRGQVLAVISSVELAEARAQLSPGARDAEGRREQLRARTADRQSSEPPASGLSKRPGPRACPPGRACRRQERACAGKERAGRQRASSSSARQGSSERESSTPTRSSPSRIWRPPRPSTSEIPPRWTPRSPKSAQAEARIEKAKSSPRSPSSISPEKRRSTRAECWTCGPCRPQRPRCDSARIEVQAAADRIRVLGADPGGSGRDHRRTSPDLRAHHLAQHQRRRDGLPRQRSSPSPTCPGLDRGGRLREGPRQGAQGADGRDPSRRLSRHASSPAGSIPSATCSAPSRARPRCGASCRNSSGLLRGEMFARCRSSPASGAAPC